MASYETSSTTASSPVPVRCTPQGHLVAAGRVDVVHLGVERLAQTRPDGALVVVEDELLVQVHSAATSSPNIAGTRSSAVEERVDLGGGVVRGERTRAVVAGTPNRRCSGHAQWWPDPDGDAAVVEDLADVVGVHAVDDERHRSRRARTRSLGADDA